MSTLQKGTFSQVDENGNVTLLYPTTSADKIEGLDVYGPVEAYSTNEIDYTATIEGVTELIRGMKVIIIPNVISNSKTPTFNLNGLGAKLIRVRSSYNTGSYTQPTNISWMIHDYPITLTYNGWFWVVDDFHVPTMDGVNGVLPIANGGTGASTIEEAKANLGITDGGVVSVGTTDVDQFTTALAYLAVSNYRTMVSNGTWTTPKFLYIDNPYGCTQGLLIGISTTSFMLIDFTVFQCIMTYANGKWTKKALNIFGASEDASDLSGITL